ncbi:VOC family protein [Microbacterium sp.]|uniref:VOC family protein n=1 Tax=Microbacterium sp. TaxID=51671 RepID=UPI003221D3E2
MQKITPNLWFAGDAAEGAELYASTFPNARVVSTSYYPDEGLPDFQREFAGKPLTVSVEIDGFRIQLINAGASYRPNPSLSFMVNFDPSSDPDARERIDDVWAKLADGGRVLMPLGEYPFSVRYGWVEDRFGVNWQLILTDPTGEPRPFVMPAFLFSGDAQDRAREAVDYYTSVLPDSRLGSLVEYPQQSGPAAAGAVMFADFTLAGQWFVAMDSAAEMSEGFTPGYSLSVECADQDEIDRLWDALSSVPEAEQCGWCVDRFGVSWQVVPERMDELMEAPGAFQAMLEMKKLVIADLHA